MNNIRRILGFWLVVMALGAFSLPAAADGGDLYRLVVPTAATGGAQAISVTITNRAGYDYLKSFTITAPAGVTISAKPTSPTIPANKISFNSTTGVTTVSGIAISNNQSATLNMTAVFPAATCGAQTFTWGSSAQGGFFVSNEVFTLDAANSNVKTTVTGACAITTSVSPAGSGTVSCSPNPVPYNGSSTCTATANPGYTFAAFSGACTGATCSLTNVTSVTSVTANFTQNVYPVNGSTSAGGTVTCNPTSVTYGMSSTCSVAVNPGYSFTGFSPNCTGGGTSCTVSNVQSAQTVTATYSQIPYTITGAASPTAGGSVTCTPSPVTYGQSSSCTAVPNALYTFTGFSANCSGSGTSCTVSNVQSSQTVTATFVSNVLTISQPTSGALNTPFSVTVGINPPGVTDLSLGSNCGATSSVTASTAASVTYSVTIATMPASKSCTLTAHQTNYTDASTTAFTVYQVGSQACDAPNYTSNNPSPPSSLDPDLDLAYVGAAGDWGLRREINTDSSTCNPVNFTLTVDTGGNVSNLVYDKANGQANGAFKYVVLWAPRPVDPSGWTTFRPRVSWGIPNPDASAGSTDYVPAINCVSDPSDWSVLTPAQLVALLPVIPSDPAFSGNPNAQFQPGQTAKMCILQQGFTLLGGGQIQYWDKVLDESDGHVAGP